MRRLQWRAVGVVRPGLSAWRLIAMGAGPRLAFAAFIVALIWAGFLWATWTPGAL